MAVNKLIATQLAAFADFENQRRRERQRQGIKAAQERGVYFERKTVIDEKLIKKILEYKNKNLSITEISKLKGHSRTTIYKALKQEFEKRENS